MSKYSTYYNPNSIEFVEFNGEMVVYKIEVSKEIISQIDSRVYNPANLLECVNNKYYMYIGAIQHEYNYFKPVMSSLDIRIINIKGNGFYAKDDEMLDEIATVLTKISHDIGIELGKKYTIMNPMIEEEPFNLCRYCEDPAYANFIDKSIKRSDSYEH